MIWKTMSTYVFWDYYPTLTLPIKISQELHKSRTILVNFHSSASGFRSDKENSRTYLHGCTSNFNILKSKALIFLSSIGLCINVHSDHKIRIFFNTNKCHKILLLFISNLTYSLIPFSLYLSSALFV